MDHRPDRSLRSWPVLIVYGPDRLWSSPVRFFSGYKTRLPNTSPAQVQSLGGHSYSHMFEDLYSQEPCVTFLKWKSEAFESYKLYETWVKVCQSLPESQDRSSL